MNLIILDAGHNEYVSGKEAPDKSMREFEFNDWMQKYLKPRLIELGFKVYLTNPNPYKKNEIGLTKRANLANDYWKSLGKPNALFISIHANAFGVWTNANGPETYHALNASTKSKQASKLINDEVYATIKQLRTNSVNRGVKAKNWTVIQKASMPSILVEYAFYTNKDDLKILKNNRKDLAEATIRGICKHFNVTYVPPKTQDNTSQNSSNTQANQSNAKYKNGAYSRKAKVTASSLRVRGGRPGQANYDKILDFLPKGTIIKVEYCLNGWFSIYTDKANPGFICGDYIELI